MTLQFGIITYEHDYYCDNSKSYRDKSRKLLQEAGYVLMAGNISPDNNSPYEDWWINKKYIKEYLIDNKKRVLFAKDYMFNSDIFDWGPCETNTKFKDILTKEIIIDKVYTKYFDVEKNDIVVDLGANIGLWSYYIKNKKPKHIYALEPELECYITAKNNLKFYNNSTVINKAIAEKSGHKVIKGLFNKNSMVCYSNQDTSCPTISLKDFVNEYNIDKIDFLKVDCEGGEYEVFNEENYEWIMKNVAKIAGEFHFADINDKRNFIKFRELYLPKNKDNWKILSMDLEDITHKVWDNDFVKDNDWDFICFNLYIDNRN
jgi:FkbM family methyltransferase